MRAFEVGRILDPGEAVGKWEFLDVIEEAGSRSVHWGAAAAGDRFEWDGVTIDVLLPDSAALAGETNEGSVVLRVRYGAFDALLTGDAYKEQERRIAGQVGEVEVLKVGHHGSDTSTDSLLLAAARPVIGVVSVGRGNRYGHPTAAVLSRLAQAGVRVVRTDEEGTVSIVARADGSFVVRSDRRGRKGAADRSDPTY